MARAADVLNKIKWTADLSKCEITILHRGAPGDRKTISGGKITDIRKDRFCYQDIEETCVPMHRILEIKFGGKVVWAKVSSRAAESGS